MEPTPPGGRGCSFCESWARASKSAFGVAVRCHCEAPLGAEAIQSALRGFPGLLRGAKSAARNDGPRSVQKMEKILILGQRVTTRIPGARFLKVLMFDVFASAPFVVGKSAPLGAETQIPAEESLCPVLSHDWVNSEYKHLIVEASPKALAVKPGQFFNLLCPSPDMGELWLRRPQSVYRIDRDQGRIEFLYKCVGRGTRGLATIPVGDALNMVGPLGIGFSLDPSWKSVVVLGRGVGLATLAPISQLAGENGVAVTAILSARSPEFVMADDLFGKVGEAIGVLDTDGSSAVENVEAILKRLIREGRADAFYTCGSNRLMQLMKRLGKEHGIPGQVAMEQIMACGLGPCYVCVKTFEVNGEKVLRRVCIEGPVFDLQEAVGW
jgi:dihydroorotate dehydrogenase electron transfer subunit